MHVFILLFLVIFLIISLEKPRLIAGIVHNFGNLKMILLNIFYIAPFIMLFFNTESLSSWISNKTTNFNSFNKNKNKYQNWWDDPSKQTKFKTKQLRKVSESTKKMVASNQHWKCFMCHNLLDYSYEIDHNVPLFAGGTNHISNLHALCRNCHGKKTIMEKININN
jgi:hypothetical protein